MLTDIPATVSSILNLNIKFNGQSVFKIDPQEVRKRKYYYYNTSDLNWQGGNLYHLYEYNINGSVFDRGSWQLSSTFHLPSLSH